MYLKQLALCGLLLFSRILLGQPDSSLGVKAFDVSAQPSEWPPMLITYDTLFSQSYELTIDDAPLSLTADQILVREYLQLRHSEDSSYLHLDHSDTANGVSWLNAPPRKTVLVPIHTGYRIDTIWSADIPGKVMGWDTVIAYNYTTRYHWTGTATQIGQKLNDLTHLAKDHPGTQYSLWYNFGDTQRLIIKEEPLKTITEVFKQSFKADKPRWFSLVLVPDPEKAAFLEVPILIEIID